MYELSKNSILTKIDCSQLFYGVCRFVQFQLCRFHSKSSNLSTSPILFISSDQFILSIFINFNQFVQFIHSNNFVNYVHFGQNVNLIKTVHLLHFNSLPPPSSGRKWMKISTFVPHFFNVSEASLWTMKSSFAFVIHKRTPSSISWASLICSREKKQLMRFWKWKFPTRALNSLVLRTKWIFLKNTCKQLRSSEASPHYITELNILQVSFTLRIFAQNLQGLIARLQRSSPSETLGWTFCLTLWIFAPNLQGLGKTRQLNFLLLARPQRSSPS